MSNSVILIVAAVLLIAVLCFWLIGERWRLMRGSTRAAMRLLGVRKLLNGSALHMYIYGRWPSRYVGFLVNRVLPRLSEHNKQIAADHYHAKVLTHDHAKAIVTLDRDVPLRDLEQVIPYAQARKLVLDAPPEIAVFECACRGFRANPCEPTRVCMAMGQPFVDFILDHHLGTSRRLTQSEALELLREEHERGHLHSAWFKNVMLDRFYAICNCCKCCCGGIEAMIKHGVPLIAPSGYAARIDPGLCAGCGVCVKACLFDALSLGENSSQLDWEKCMGCGVCVDQCPNNAISLERDEGKGIPLDARLLTADG